MLDEDPTREEGAAEELLRRALLDDSSAVAVSLRVSGLPLSEAVTVIFHGRRDLGTLQTYVACGSRGAGATVSASELLRVPCDLDLADAEDREEAERLYVEQATALRDALVGADTVLDVWREPLSDLAGSGVAVDHSVQLSVKLPAHRLLPTALVATESQLVVTPVCSARTLADGRPPMGIACAQQDLSRVYPLADDPERCVEDFLELAAEHALLLAERLEHQEASVQRFMELSDSAERRRAAPRRVVGYRARRCAAAGSSPRSSLGVVVFLAISALLTRALQRRRRRGRGDHQPRPGRGPRRHRRGHLADHRLHGQRRLPRPRRPPIPPRCATPARSRSPRSTRHRRSRSPPPSARRAWPGWRATHCRACSACASATPAACCQGFTIQLLVVSRRIASDADCPQPLLARSVRRAQPGGAGGLARRAPLAVGQALAEAAVLAQAHARGDRVGQRDAAARGLRRLRGTLGPRPQPSSPSSGRRSGPIGVSFSAGNISRATQPSPRRWTPAIQSIRAAPLMAQG